MEHYLGEKLNGIAIMLFGFMIARSFGINHMKIWLVAAAITLCGLIVVLRAGRKKKSEE